VVIIEGIKGLS